MTSWQRDTCISIQWQEETNAFICINRRLAAKAARDSAGRPRSETAVLVGPRTAVVTGLIEFRFSDLRQADGNCRDRTTISRWQADSSALMTLSRRWLADNWPTVLQRRPRRILPFNLIETDWLTVWTLLRRAIIQVKARTPVGTPVLNTNNK